MKFIFSFILFFLMYLHCFSQQPLLVKSVNESDCFKVKLKYQFNQPMLSVNSFCKLDSFWFIAYYDNIYQFDLNGLFLRKLPLKRNSPNLSSKYWINSFKISKTSNQLFDLIIDAADSIFYYNDKFDLLKVKPICSSGRAGYIYESSFFKRSAYKSCIPVSDNFEIIDQIIVVNDNEPDKVIANVKNISANSLFINNKGDIAYFCFKDSNEIKIFTYNQEKDSYDHIKIIPIKKGRHIFGEDVQIIAEKDNFFYVSSYTDALKEKQVFETIFKIDTLGNIIKTDTLPNILQELSKSKIKSIQKMNSISFSKLTKFYFDGEHTFYLRITKNGTIIRVIE